MRVFLIAGARPNFMKIAPIYRESLKHNRVCCKIVHTGQHYDYEMSQVFFQDLELPEPDFFLNAGSGTHAVQTARIIIAFEELCQDERPDLVVVVGDVNSTLACSVVAKKLLIDVAVGGNYCPWCAMRYSARKYSEAGHHRNGNKHPGRHQKRIDPKCL